MPENKLFVIVIVIGIVIVTVTVIVIVIVTVYPRALSTALVCSLRILTYLRLS